MVTTDPRQTITDSYDGKDELSSAVEKNSGGTTTASWVYCYDNAGNRTSASTTAGATCPSTATTYTYNAANELTALNGTSTGWSYDGDGNETAGASSTARTAETCTASNQLSSVTTGGVATAMTYAGLFNTERVTLGSGSMTPTSAASPNKTPQHRAQTCTHTQGTTRSIRPIPQASSASDTSLRESTSRSRPHLRWASVQLSSVHRGHSNLRVSAFRPSVSSPAHLLLALGAAHSVTRPIGASEAF